eukprot:symbB.v1.2.024483.t1/scaffold2323.1/size82334/3
MEAIAFDEADGHLSNLFKGRLFRVHIGKWIEECVVTDVSTHPVEQELMFVRFDRHIPGRMTVVPIPVSISGLWGCPGYRKGGHVEVALPTVNCEVVGEKIPPPLVVDVSNLHLEQPFGKITLRDMLPLLPQDGTGTMLRERLEVDIVVFITNDYIRETCMKSFQDCISKMWQLGSDVKLNRHSVQFTHPRTTVEVDMLFTYDLDAKSGFDVFLNRRGFQRQWSGKRKRNKTLTDFDMLRESSSSVAEDQVKLIAEADKQTISLIQLAKALKTRFMDATHTYLPSYLLEIFVLDYMQEKVVFNFDDGLQYVFSQLRDLETDFVFHRCCAATQAGITSEDVESYWRGHKQWSAGAVVPDPVNPLHNVATMLNAWMKR